MHVMHVASGKIILILILLLILNAQTAVVRAMAMAVKSLPPPIHLLATGEP